MDKVRLDVYSHHVVVSQYHYGGYKALYNLGRSLSQFQMVKLPYGGFQREILRTFATGTANRREFRFHRHMLDEVVRHLVNFGGYRQADIELRHHEVKPGHSIDIVFNPKYVLRDYQEPIVDFLSLRDDPDGKVIPKHRRVVTLRTGGGKTLSLLCAVSRIQQRTVIVIKGMYVKKWIKDIEDAFKNHKKAKWKKGDLMVVRGSKQLIDLIDVAKRGELKAKIIIITNATLQMFFMDYEATSGESQFYGCTPLELYPLLEAGIRVIDEAHEYFHLNFKQDLYSHIPLTLELSATLEPDDKFLDRMYRIMYPLDLRFSGGGHDKYIAVTALFYSMRNAYKLRVKRRGQYSHVVFEQQLMRQPGKLKAYMELIRDTAEVYYIRKHQPGQKLLIFAATTDFCKILADYLRQIFTGFEVNHYISGVDYNVLLNSDISVSTLKSAGTAVDIDGLRTCIMTDALDTSQGNIQALGRLRRLKAYPDVTPEFIYLVCQDIDKHVRYHNRKMDKFEGRVLSHKEVQSGHVI